MDFSLHHTCRVEPGKNSSISNICKEFGNVTEWDIPSIKWLDWVSVTNLNQKQLGSFNDWAHT